MRQLGAEAIASIVEDLIFLNSELRDKLNKLKKLGGRFVLCDAPTVEQHDIVVHLPEDTESTDVEPPNPTHEAKKRPALAAGPRCSKRS